jgi:hypothetical protein
LYRVQLLSDRECLILWRKGNSYDIIYHLSNIIIFNIYVFISILFYNK